MSSDETPNVPTPSNSREAVREKAQQVHAQQSRARLMRRIIIGAVAVIAVGAIGTAVTLAVSAQVSKPQLTPTGMESDGVVVNDISAVAASDETLTTPSPEPTEAEGDGCSDHGAERARARRDPRLRRLPVARRGEFERANSRQLANWITEGAVTVSYHPVALLTASSNGTKYSLRAAAAAACVATHSPEQFYAFNHDLLDNQPKVGSDGFSDAQLADAAQAVGVDNPKAVRSCIVDGDFVTWAKEATTRALDGPLIGSDDLVLSSAPMIVANGEAYVGALDDPAEFSNFMLTIDNDASQQSTETPTPTPSPTATPTP